jgi:hypothetical protein
MVMLAVQRQCLVGGAAAVPCPAAAGASAGMAWHGMAWHADVTAAARPALQAPPPPTWLCARSCCV